MDVGGGETEGERHQAIVVCSKRCTDRLLALVALEGLHLLDEPRGADLEPAVTESTDQGIDGHLARLEICEPAQLVGDLDALLLHQA